MPQGYCVRWAKRTCDIEIKFGIGACRIIRTSEVRQFGASMFSVTGPGNSGKEKNHAESSRMIARAKRSDVSWRSGQAVPLIDLFCPHSAFADREHGELLRVAESEFALHVCRLREEARG